MFSTIILQACYGQVIREPVKKITKKDFDQIITLVKEIIWCYVMTYYVKNTKLRSISTRRNSNNRHARFVFEHNHLLCPNKLKIHLKSIYNRYYVNELRDVKWTELMEILHAFDNCAK